MIILCADDFGLSDGVSRGIVELCRARRLSATSALVTPRSWSMQAAHLRDIRPTTAIGLHFNLTLGRPQLTMQNASHLSRTGAFLPLGQLVLRALTRRLSMDHIRRECSAQIAAFEAATGSLPDFIDGHQHVHALPVIRHGVIAAIAEQRWNQQPLLRSPADRDARYAINSAAALKKRAVDWLTGGFAAELRKAGLPSNETFAGFSAFTVGSDYHHELEAALAQGERTTQDTHPRQARSCHLVMCHPGHVDEALTSSGDPLIARRQEEFDALMAAEHLPQRIWHPERGDDGAIDWFRAMAR